MATVEGTVGRKSATTVVAIAAVFVLLTMGIRQSWGLFVPLVADEFQTGREPVSLAFAVQNLMFGLPLVPILADRFGGRRVMVVSVFVVAAGMVLASAADGALTFGASLGPVVGLGLSGASLVVALGAVGRVVPQERQSTMFGLITAAGSIGMLLVVPGIQALLDQLDWRATLVVLAGVVAALSLLATAMPGGATHSEDDRREPLPSVFRRASRNKSYGLLTAGFFVCGFHVAFIATHLPGYLRDAGLATFVGATALGLIGAFNVAGSFIFGALGDRYRRRKLLSFLYFARAAVFAVFLAVPLTTVSTLVFAGAIGFLWLATVPLTSGIVAQIFGTKDLSTLYGVVFFSHQVGAFLGVWLGGRVFDTTGSYDPVWLAAIALGVFAGLVHIPIRESPAT